MTRTQSFDVAVVGYEWLGPGHEVVLGAAERLGLRATRWSPDRLSVEVRGAKARALVDGAPARAGIVLPRGVNKVLPFVECWLDCLDPATTVVNSSAAAALCADKLASTIALGRAGVPTLHTTASLLQTPGTAHIGPVVVKPAMGSRGHGVEVFHALVEANAALGPPPERNPDVAVYEHRLVQPLATGRGIDYRLVVANGRVVASTTREAPQGTIVTNGPEASVTPGAPVGAAPVALAAAEALGVAFAGVDVIIDHDQFVVLEVNAYPGVVHTSEVCGIDLGEVLVHTALAQAEKPMPPAE